MINSFNSLIKGLFYLLKYFYNIGRGIENLKASVVFLNILINSFF